MFWAGVQVSWASRSMFAFPHYQFFARSSVQYLFNTAVIDVVTEQAWFKGMRSVEVFYNNILRFVSRREFNKEELTKLSQNREYRMSQSVRPSARRETVLYRVYNVRAIKGDLSSVSGGLLHRAIILVVLHLLHLFFLVTF